MTHLLPSPSTRIGKNRFRAFTRDRGGNVKIRNGSKLVTLQLKAGKAMHLGASLTPLAK